MFDLEEYLSTSVGHIVRDMVKTSKFNINQNLFITKFAVSSRNATNIRLAHAKEGNHIPAFLISSITSTCNLHCAGCYSRSNGACHDGAAHDQLSDLEWHRIFKEARSLGINFIFLAGGEPLIRRDVINKAAKSKDIIFPIFTNGTMIDDEYIQLFDKNRNLIPVLSIEGEQETTDNRRGAGVYSKLINVMDRMKENQIMYGASITLNHENIDEVTSDSFVKKLNERGCKAVFYVEYVNADNAEEDIAPNDDDREYLNDRLTALRQEYDNMMFITFPGDEIKSGGCLAAGRGFFHINSTGGAEPCPFSPYSDMNVRDASLLDVINSKLFTELRSSDILTSQHDGACVLFTNRKKVEEIVNSK